MVDRSQDEDRGRLAFLPLPLRRTARLAIAVVRWPGRKLLGILRRLHPRRVRATWRWGRLVVAATDRRREAAGLTVAVDITPLWGPLTGVGWYLYRLLESLATREGLGLRLYGPGMVPHPDDAGPTVPLPVGPAVEVVSYPVDDDLCLPRDWAIWLVRRLEPFLVARDANQVLFAPNYFLPPRFRCARGALVAMVHDLSVERFPWTMKEETHTALVAHLEKTVSRAAVVLTHTETVRSEILATPRFRVAKGPGVQDESPKVHAIAPGPGHLGAVVPAPPPPEVPSPFALHVGTLEPRKNVATLLEAWRRLQEGGESLPLVLCGDLGWKSEALREEIARGQARGWLHHLGYAPDSTLAGLYRETLLVVCPSLYEGFGLPLVEALLAGAPVVASDIPVFREVAGDAVLYAAAQDPAAWAGQVHRLHHDEELRRRLADRGRRRAADLSWEKTARETWGLWRRVAGGGGGDSS